MSYRRTIPALLASLLCFSLLTAAEQQPKIEKAQPEKSPSSKSKELDKDKAARSETVMREMIKFQGTWNVESQETNGKAAPASDVKGRTIFFGGELFILRKGAELLQVGVTKIDPTKNPPTINATVTKGLYQGETMLGIYQFDGDQLKVCFEIEGVNRPTDFKTAAGEGRFVAVYRRVPPAADEKDDIVGKYESVSTDLEGKEHKADAEISRQGDAYLVRYTKDKALAYIGIGLRRGNILAVTWANRGEVGLSVYRIQKDGSMIGDYTQLGSIGIVNSENLRPKKSETATKIEQE